MVGATCTGCTENDYSNYLSSMATRFNETEDPTEKDKIDKQMKGLKEEFPTDYNFYLRSTGRDAETVKRGG